MCLCVCVCVCVCSEWLRLKVSGQRCESLELDTEDRRRIEEIKREILLLRPLQVDPGHDRTQTHTKHYGSQWEPEA